MTASVKKVLFVAGISVLALTDMATAVAYLGMEESLFIGDAIASDMV